MQGVSSGSAIRVSGGVPDLSLCGENQGKPFAAVPPFPEFRVSWVSTEKRAPGINTADQIPIQQRHPPSSQVRVSHLSSSSLRYLVLHPRSPGHLDAALTTQKDLYSRLNHVQAITRCLINAKRHRTDTQPRCLPIQPNPIRLPSPSPHPHPSLLCTRTTS